MSNSSLQFRDSLGINNTFGAQTAVTASAANSLRSGFQIQNLDTGVLYVKLGAGASTTSYSFILKGDTLALDGTGGIFPMLAGDVYRGVITVASAGTPSYAFLEI